MVGWIGACAFGHDEAGAVVVAFGGSARSAASIDGGLTFSTVGRQFVGGAGWGTRDLEFIGDRFVAAGDLGVSTSGDGVTWTVPAGPGRLSHLTHGNGLTVVISGGIQASSADFVNWTQSSGGGGDVIFAEGRFLIVGDGFRQTSTDGVTWTRAGQPPMSRVKFGVVNGQPRYVGANFPDQRRTSSDGITWTDTARDNGNAIDDLIFVP